MTSRIITIFGSGTAASDSKACQTAYLLGSLLAQNGFTIANGGYWGTMEAAAKGAKEAGGKTIAVTVSEFGGSKNQFAESEIKTKKYQDRLFELIRIGDAFVILNGATGTIAETAIVIEMMNKGLLSKPVVVIGNHIKKFVAFLKKLPDGKVPKELVFKKTPEETAEYLSLTFSLSAKKISTRNGSLGLPRKR